MMVFADWVTNIANLDLIIGKEVHICIYNICIINNINNALNKGVAAIG